MVTDLIENIALYKNLGKRIAKGLQYLKETDLAKLENGKQGIDGTDIFAAVSSYETKNPEECKYEAHRKYIDIQYIISGSERLYYAPLKTAKETTSYDAEKDICFLQANGDFVTALPGTFIIFYPTDAHKPCISNGKPSLVKKIVIKVRV